MNLGESRAGRYTVTKTAGERPYRFNREAAEEANG